MSVCAVVLEVEYQLSELGLVDQWLCRSTKPTFQAGRSLIKQHRIWMFMTFLMPKSQNWAESKWASVLKLALVRAPALMCSDNWLLTLLSRLVILYILYLHRTDGLDNGLQSRWQLRESNSHFGRGKGQLKSVFVRNLRTGRIPKKNSLSRTTWFDQLQSILTSKHLDENLIQEFYGVDVVTRERSGQGFNKP